jgi:hypothetical protein
MGLVTRFIFASLAAAGTYFAYIYLPAYLLGYLAGTNLLQGQGFSIGGIAQINIGNFDNLVAFITALGFVILGCTFATGMAADKTWLKAVWKLVNIFLKISFWSIFILIDFTTINVSAALGTAINLNLDLDITLLFWVIIGGNIFGFIIAILDFFVAFEKEPEKKKKEKKE